MQSPDSIGPAGDAIQYADFSADIDVTAVAGGPARWIRVEDAGSGTLVVVTGAGVERTFTVTDGWELSLQVQRIDATTDVGRVTVAW